jgi:hypothetical protein
MGFMLVRPLLPTGLTACRPATDAVVRRRVPGLFAVVVLALLALLAGAVEAVEAAETDLIWTDGRPDPSGSYQLPSLLQESAPVGEPVTQALVQPLPSTQPRGPVVLDMPYEAAPCSPDECTVPGAGFPEGFDDLWAPRPWSWQIMPNNLIYTSYLAGPKEPRLATVWYDDTAPDPFDPAIKNGWMWDMTAGARVSLLRYGSDPVLHPQGFELQVEGAAFVRLDQQDEVDLRSSDYRFGIPLVFGIGRWQTKLAYYHLSAHLGDESMLKHQSFPRVNYLRDAMVWGNSYYLLDWMRIYGDVGYAFQNSGGSEPWEFQAGVELIQARPTGPRGAPFFAINGMSRQELNWGGNVCVQTGWAWRGRRSERLMRIGFEYLNGSDPQYEFVFYNQNRCGIGMWYDF